MNETPHLGNRSNCLVFALRRWFSNSGYLLVRKSHFGWWPHFLWSPDVNRSYVEHYAPIVGQRKALPPPLFQGTVQTSDKVHDAPSDIFTKIESVLFIFFCSIVGVFGMAGACIALAVVVPFYRLVRGLANRSRTKALKSSRRIPVPIHEVSSNTTSPSPQQLNPQRPSRKVSYDRDLHQKRPHIPESRRNKQRYWVLH